MKFLVSNCIFQMCVIEFLLTESHMFAVLGDISSHLLAGSMIIFIKRFDVIRIGWRQSLAMRTFVCFKVRSNLSVEQKSDSRLAGKGGKDVNTLWPHVLIVVDSTKEASRW